MNQAAFNKECDSAQPSHADKTDIREVEIIGALAGFLSAAAPELSAQSETLVGPVARADFVITSQDERLIIEVKRGRGPSDTLKYDAINQMLFYMDDSDIHQGIIFIYNVPNQRNVSQMGVERLSSDARLIIVTLD